MAPPIGISVTAGEIQRLRSVAEQSSPPGTHGKWLLVRVALRTEAGEALQAISDATIIWFESGHHVVRLRLSPDALIGP